MVFKRFDGFLGGGLCRPLRLLQSAIKFRGRCRLQQPGACARRARNSFSPDALMSENFAPSARDGSLGSLSSELERLNVHESPFATRAQAGLRWLDITEVS